MKSRQVVAVAGASGFVGRALLPILSECFHVVALTRKGSPGGNRETGDAVIGRVEWRGCDLFSLLEAEKALSGADFAVYLVHHMMPAARLTQGSFADLDLISANNFARAARAAGIRQIVYLGGLIPQNDDLSRHLESRLEVERELRSTGVPVTALRAGLILGPGGSSFDILVRLVGRLPALLCPAWTSTRTQPVALDDVVSMIASVIGDPSTFGETADVGGPDVMTYREMLARTAEVLRLKRPFVAFPFLTPRLSTLWVSTVTGAPRQLVGPLVMSLRHPMVARDRSLQLRKIGEGIPFDEAVRRALPAQGAAGGGSSLRRMAQRPSGNAVRSVQRLPLPEGWNALDVSREYLRWLPNFTRPFLRVRILEDGRCEFRFVGVPRELLVLNFSEERSSDNRPLFYIRGGLLAQTHEKGRLEFREVLDGKAILAAIHDFRPTLPWFIYVNTQARVHLSVMKSFRRHLGRLATRGEPRRP
ncbi:MAG: NAD(P)H-binding protein [Thermoanaerobaculia bacterium]|nr:hypothetical protein [Thermoanaerobaculia bacterium]MCK6682336.1 NAD(P)H-binding protein [Thermoanaerobaculia bacterium]